MALAVGSLGYVDYGERPRCIHVRLIVGHVKGNEYIVVTPDHDMYSEILNVAENPDITGLVLATAPFLQVCRIVRYMALLR